MKKILSFLFLLFVSLASSGNTPHRSNHLYALFQGYDKDMESEYGVYVIRHTITAMPKVKKIAVDFYEYSEVEIPQGRFLLHQVTEELLKRINMCKYVRPFLDHYPLTEEDIEVSISFLDPKTHKGYTHGKLAYATLLKGNVHYSEYHQPKERAKEIHQEKYIPSRLYIKSFER
jgi:hypothetical protein